MRFAGIFGSLALAACSPQALVQAAYPDRQVFEFPTSDGVSIVSYACAPGEDDIATQARATQAHIFVDRNVSAAADIFADQIIESVDNDQSLLGASIGAANGLNANADRIVEAAEARYQCLLFDERAA